MNKTSLHNANNVTANQTNAVQLNLFDATKRGEYKGRELDTSVKFGTRNSQSLIEIVRGNGIDINDTISLNKKARKKYITLTTIFKLIDIAKEEGNKEIEHSLWNTYHCLRKLKFVDGRLYGEYCKNKFCTVCNGNRKAELVTKYLPVLENWKEPYFVTLTIKSSEKDSFEQLVNDMLEAFLKIQNKYKTRYRRGTGILLKGLRTLESNFNSETRTYNPHFHLLVPNKKIAYTLRKEWEDYWDIKRVNPDAQDVQKVYNKEKVLIEVIKYTTTIFTEKNKYKKGGDYYIYLKALYNIICALNGRHVIEPFGFRLPKQNKSKTNTKLVVDPPKYNYINPLKDWANENTGEILTRYNPSQSLENILQNKMDTKLE